MESNHADAQKSQDISSGHTNHASIISVARWVWLLVYTAVSRLFCLFWSIGVQQSPGINMNRDVVSSANTPFQAEEMPVSSISTRTSNRVSRNILKVYTQIRGVDGKQAEAARLAIDAFHNNSYVKRALWKIKDTNTFYGIHHKKTVVGNGCFNGEKTIPARTTLFFYIAALSTHEIQEVDGDASYLYDYGCLHGVEGLKFFADAKFTVDAMQLVNGAFLNHSCTRFNCIPYWNYNQATDIWFLVFKTKRAVQPYEQLTISYNFHDSRDIPSNPYFETLASLKQKRVPRKRLVKCLCEHPKKCPLDMGFDRLEIYGTPDGELYAYGPG